MKFEELAFVNRQLAGMLGTGIPLEGALRQLCAHMRQGPLRQELERLEASLAQGTPLSEAVAAGNLPPFYVAMVRVGAQSQDLPGVLTLLADHYHQVNKAWLRLKGLMLYPLLVLVAALGLSLVLSLLLHRLCAELFEMNMWAPNLRLTWLAVWISPAVLSLAVLAILAAFVLRPWRAWLRWRLPGFREASLSQVASSLSILLSHGAKLDEALELIKQTESQTAAGAELSRWQERLRAGHGSLEGFAADSRVFPQLFLWLAANSGQDLAAGFRRAAQLYHERALHRIEMILYACLPVTVLLLGFMIAGQLYPVVRIFISLGGEMGADW